MVYGNRKAWYRQDELQKKYQEEEVPSIEELDNITNSINIGKVDQELHTLRARALFIIYYLTACRASEVVETKYLHKQISEEMDGQLFTWNW